MEQQLGLPMVAREEISGRQPVANSPVLGTPEDAKPGPGLLGWLFWSMIGLLDGNLTGIPSIEFSQSLFTMSENRGLVGGRTRTSSIPFGGVFSQEVHCILTIFDRLPTTTASTKEPGQTTVWLVQLVQRYPGTR